MSANSWSVAGVCILSVVAVVGVISGGRSVSTCMAAEGSGTGTPTLASKLHKEPDSTEEVAGGAGDDDGTVDVCSDVMMLFSVVPKSPFSVVEV